MQDFFDRFAEAFATLGGQEVERIGPLPFLFLLLVSAASSIVLSYLYLKFYGGRSTGSEVHRAFPLIGVATTAIFLSIQFSLPLSLGLLGALSIVRFRTPIKEPEEIGFILVVIASALACATFNLGFLAGLLVTTLIVLALKERATPIFRRSPERGLLFVTFDEEGYDGASAAAFAEEVPRGRVESITRAGGDVVVAIGFRGVEPRRLPELEEAARRLAGARETSLAMSAAPLL